MRKPKPAWHAMLPGGLTPSSYSLEELRAAKQVHGFLTAELDGPPSITGYIRDFRFLTFFGVACVAEDRYPPLTRCWNDLGQRFMNDPAFGDGVFIESWVFMDFPFGPAGQTLLDYFEDFLRTTESGPHFEPFLRAARASRLGLHQDVRRTKRTAEFRELLGGNQTKTVPSVVHYERGEILLTRMIAAGDDVYVWGNPKGFPKQAKQRIEDMVLDKLFLADFDATDPTGNYERFMKVAGPYWMSCVCSDPNAPILDPNHYRTYLDRPDASRAHASIR